MHILIIKTSSLGDIIHTLPAVTDAVTVYPKLTVDWLIEKPFQEIPIWHRAVRKVIPVSWREWRTNIVQNCKNGNIPNFLKVLRQQRYDYVIDAQGLVKSAVLSVLSRGARVGLDWYSARESVASLLYHHSIFVPKKKHAVERIRQLFATILGYQEQTLPLDYGIQPQLALQVDELPFIDYQPYCIFLHATTWATKHWPNQYWKKLAEITTQNGLRVLLPWNNLVEYQRAIEIAEGLSNVIVLPQMNLSTLAIGLLKAKAVVAVDTGLAHLAAALSVPTITLYGPTDRALTGAFGQDQVCLSVKYPCAPCLKRKCPYSQTETAVNPPCFTTLSPGMIWRELLRIL